QTIALLEKEKTIDIRIRKCSAIADHFKSSKEVLKESQLLIDALRHQN
ncbi:43617_t:CDS:1, partial [Gigaspora margarita]